MSLYAKASARKFSGRRFSAGWLSGSATVVSSASSSEKAHRNQKIACQSRQPRIQPPTIGAIAGATPKIIEMLLISRCASSPCSASRTTARPTIRPTPADRPWMARKNSICGIVSDIAQPTEARPNTAMPARITGRRPRASDSGPCTSDMPA